MDPDDSWEEEDKDFYENCELCAVGECMDGDNSVMEEYILWLARTTNA